MRYRNWLKELQRLPAEKIMIRHNPPTDRYVYNAAVALPRILRDGEIIGWRKIPAIDGQKIELVIWAAPLNPGQCGFYVGCRLRYGEDGPALGASIFCFYDGSDKSPCHKTKHEAVQSMRSWACSQGVQYTEANHD